MKVKLWTILNEMGWKELQTKGVLIPKLKHIDPHFKQGYDWMKKQMIKRLGDPKIKDQYPVWAWYQYLNSNKRKPDLRSSGYLPRGTKGYRIEFKKDKKDILLSEFELWHYVLNKWYLPYDTKDDEALKKEMEGLSHKNLPKDIQCKIEESWGKIFDVDFESTDICAPFNEKSIQATCWELQLSDINKVDKFIAK